MSLYLDTNVFYHAYCPFEDSALIDWLLEQFHPDFQAVTSEWSLIEMFRAFKKQVNLGTIDAKNANIALDYFISDIGELVKTHHLKLVPVTNALLISSRELIFSYNLYAADSLHALTAMNSSVKAFISFDSDFKCDLGKISVLNPSTQSFKKEIRKLIG